MLNTKNVRWNTRVIPRAMKVFLVSSKRHHYIDVRILVDRVNLRLTNVALWLHTTIANRCSYSHILSVLFRSK